MDTVSTGIFMVIDGTEALVYAAVEAEKAAKIAAESPEAAIGAGVLKGLYAFATSINFANVFNLVAVVNADRKYLIEDVSGWLEKEIKEYKQVNERIREEEKKLILDYTGFDSIESKMLYSLELNMIEKDILHTKDANIKIKKDEWKKNWMERHLSGSVPGLL